jgi:hypothetical protein
MQAYVDGELCASVRDNPALVAVRCTTWHARPAHASHDSPDVARRRRARRLTTATPSRVFSVGLCPGAGKVSVGRPPPPAFLGWVRVAWAVLPAVSRLGHRAPPPNDAFDLLLSIPRRRSNTSLPASGSGGVQRSDRPPRGATAGRVWTAVAHPARERPAQTNGRRTRTRD